MAVFIFSISFEYVEFAVGGGVLLMLFLATSVLSLGDTFALIKVKDAIE